MTRKLLWRDRQFCEQWDWSGTLVQRHRLLVSYPWTYKTGSGVDSRHFLKDGVRMTQEQVSDFKAAKVCR